MKHVKASGGLLSECSVSELEQRRLKLKYTWQLVCVCFFIRLSQLRTMTGKLNGDLCVINHTQQNVLLAPDMFLQCVWAVRLIHITIINANYHTDST